MMLVLLLAVSCAAVWVSTDLRETRRPDLQCWCSVRMMRDHRGWGANQPPNQWTQVSMIVPTNVSGIQLTIYDANKHSSRAGQSAWIPSESAKISEPGVFEFGVVYWGEPFDLFVGWTAKESICRANTTDGQTPPRDQMRRTGNK